MPASPRRLDTSNSTFPDNFSEKLSPIAQRRPELSTVKHRLLLPILRSDFLPSQLFRAARAFTRPRHRRIAPCRRGRHSMTFASLWGKQQCEPSPQHATILINQMVVSQPHNNVILRQLELPHLLSPFNHAQVHPPVRASWQVDRRCGFTAWQPQVELAGSVAAARRGAGSDPSIGAIHRARLVARRVLTQPRLPERRDFEPPPSP